MSLSFHLHPLDAQAIDQLLESLAAEKGLSRATLQAYQEDLKALCRFLYNSCVHDASYVHSVSKKEDKNEKALTPPLLHVTPLLLKQYLSSLSLQGFKATSIARHISSIKNAYTFWSDLFDLKKNPALRLKPPRTPKRFLKTLSFDDVQLLLKQASQDQSFSGIRLYALLSLLYATGMRVSEVTHLKVHHIKNFFHTPLDTPQKNSQSLNKQHSSYPLFIKGKGSKERLVFANTAAKDALKIYLEQKEKQQKKYGLSSTSAQKNTLFLFTGKNGAPLSRQIVFYRIKQLALKAGLNPAKVSPHVLRHAFAIHLLEGGADLLTLKKLLGHADLQTTQVYTSLLRKHLIQAMEKHPLNTSSLTEA